MKGIVHIPWTDEERTQLRRLWDNGLGRIKIARMMDCSVNAVSRQIQYLGLHRPNPLMVRHQEKLAEQKKRAGTSTLPQLPSLSGDV